MKTHGLPQAADDLHHLKSLGFSDKQLATLAGKTELDVRQQRHAQNVRPVFKRVDNLRRRIRLAHALYVFDV